MIFYEQYEKEHQINEAPRQVYVEVDSKIYPNKSSPLNPEKAKRKTIVSCRSDVPTKTKNIDGIVVSPAFPSLLSANKKAIASVRGNLGPPSVVTNESTFDWLSDRWQGKTAKLHNFNY